MTRHPTGGTKVTDPYGVPRPGGTTHTGTDFRAPVGTPLYASQSGIVKTGTSARAGIWTEIVNGDTVIGYSHQSKRNVKAGQYVNEGDLIGWSGQTGNVTGPHLHFYVKINGKFVDPEKWLATGATLPQPTPTPEPPIESETTMLYLMVKDNNGKYGPKNVVHFATYDGHAFVEIGAADANAIAVSNLAGRAFSNITYATWEGYHTAATTIIDARKS